MFNGKKIFRLVLLLALLVGFCGCEASASSVMLKPSSGVVSAGETFTVDVFVEPEVAIAGVQFDLEFDGSKIHLDNAAEYVAEGELFKQSGHGTFFVSGTSGPGLLQNVYGTILGAASVSTPGVFATVTLTADEHSTGISTISLVNVIISDPGSHAIEIEVKNTIVEIEDLEIGYEECDLNGDGTVNDNDYLILVQHFNEVNASSYPPWDINKDGVCNILDIQLLMSYADW
ncbi:MAG: hypothetical protein JW903_10010 [Clostridia bacterium]|nr:hypothetical protein [Clostridia bacterium]